MVNGISGINNTCLLLLLGARMDLPSDRIPESPASKSGLSLLSGLSSILSPSSCVMCITSHASVKSGMVLIPTWRIWDLSIYKHLVMDIMTLPKNPYLLLFCSYVWITQNVMSHYQIITAVRSNMNWSNSRFAKRDRDLVVCESHVFMSFPDDRYCTLFVSIPGHLEIHCTSASHDLAVKIEN